MPLAMTWHDVAIRLACALVAGALFGYDRGEHGKAAGLRTTILVCLAAAVAMIQVNYLLPLAGRQPDSFVMNDLMRFPLGILTGVGFIGAGAIMRRRELVTGVTTAATLWYITVVGLCFGGGQLWLGGVATLIGYLVLWVLKWFDERMTVEFHHRLALTVNKGVDPHAIRARLEAHAVAIRRIDASLDGDSECYTFDVITRRPRGKAAIPAWIEDLRREPGVNRLQWHEVP